jgi:hypothetical protein
MLDAADRQEDRVAEMRVNRLSERLETLRRQMRQLQAMERAVADASPGLGHRRIPRLIPRPSGYCRCPVKTGCSSATTCRRWWTPSTI